ncbi:uncharacterized protein LOC103960177 isoform X2 [Pyrus x bretschneideri]|uniref:uncharacterized protein LOC103960177 isoform X2 n=1 Tax=Pyrus x bretschneideri TaxID=225117 RepID=UPI00202DCF4E|nr:uncharacterized protein LOC103960177 isoform X2 [Pyrus x bretschneideri]
MSSRKLDKLKWKVEGHRRSPRLSALEACKADQLPRLAAAAGPTATANAGSRFCTQQRLKSQVGKDQGPAFWTRDGKKRKLRPVHEVAATAPSSPLDQGRVENGDDGHQTSTDQQVVQDKDSLKTGVHAASTDQPSTESAKWLPEKRILELILDKLQRKDTYEIFAEPVDPNEVEGYYEIIEEPMDFGTMRAKLHEGMYKNLEQFEHDAFLITENAMHFNSTATIYFRQNKTTWFLQARAIHELAKKVFHVLKTSPDNFELEFSETRQRSGRKAQGEAGRRSQVKIGCSSYIDAREHRVPSDKMQTRCTHDGRRSRSFEGDPRSTYRPWTSFLDEDESTSLTVISQLKQLEHVPQQDIGYTESLMLFVKDLGPTAQKIARKKLLGCSEMHESKAPLASTSSQLAPSRLSNVFTSPPSHNFQDKLNEHPSTMKITGKKGSLGDEMGIQSPTVGGKVQCNEIHPNSPSLKSHHAELADNSCSVSGFENTGNNSTPMILNQWKSVNQAQPLKQPSDYSFQSNFLDPRLSNMGFASFSKTKNKLSSLHLRGDDDQTKSEATQASKPDQGRPMLAQQFTFDLPYLRAQLGRINSSGQDRLSLQKGSGTELMVFPAEIKQSERDEKSVALW